MMSYQDPIFAAGSNCATFALMAHVPSAHSVWYVSIWPILSRPAWLSRWYCGPTQVWFYNSYKIW